MIGIIDIIYQVFQWTILDAKARGLKHPKFWGFFALSGNNSSGLLMYLIGRNKFPILNMSEPVREEMAKRKKLAWVGAVAFAVGVIGFLICY